MCHCALGAYFAETRTTFEATSALNSVGQLSKKIKISRMVPVVSDLLKVFKKVPLTLNILLIDQGKA